MRKMNNKKCLKLQCVMQGAQKSLFFFRQDIAISEQDVAKTGKQ